MTIDTQNINQVIKEVYNGTINAVKKVIPLEPNIGAPQLINPPLKVEFGVTIGFTGDLKGELVLQAEKGFMSEIGKVMFGMPLSDDMLDSFAGELGNMIAGSLSTYLAEKKMKTEITHPIILKGDARLSGFKRALLVEIAYLTDKKLTLHLLLNQ